MAQAADLTTPVEPGLYVGPYLYAKSRGWLQRHSITHVINATASAPCQFAEELTYLRLPLEDKPDAPIADHFAEALAFVRAARETGGSVLVHCQMGKSRSVTVAAACLMLAHGMGWRDALQQVQRARPQAAPNIGFLRQLRQLETTLLAAREEVDQPQVEEEGAALRALDGLLSTDAELDELAFVPGPLQPELFEAGDAAQGVVSAPVGPLPCGLMLAAHKLAIDRKALPTLHRETHAAWRRHRAAAVDGGGDSAGLVAASRALLLLTMGQCYTAWNDRKRMLRARLGAGDGADEAAIDAELRLSTLVVRSFPKAHEAWGHRRWLLREVRQRLGDPALLARLPAEVALWRHAQCLRPANYHAGRHLASLFAPHAPPPPPALLEQALGVSADLAARAPSDASVLHCRRAVLRAALDAAPDAATADGGGGGGGGDGGDDAPAESPAATALLVRDEMAWAERQIAQAPWLAPLWVHWRTLLSWLAHLPSQGPPTPPPMPPPPATPTSAHELDCWCPAEHAEPSRAAQLEATARRAEAACFGDDARREAAARLGVVNTQWCEQWRPRRRALDGPFYDVEL